MDVKRMSLITLKAKEIKECGLWEKVCAYKGIDANAEMNPDQHIRFDTTFTRPDTIQEMQLFAYTVTVKEYGARTEIAGIVMALKKDEAEKMVANHYTEFGGGIEITSITKESLYDEGSIVQIAYIRQE